MNNPLAQKNQDKYAQAWNAQADASNPWESLGADEKIEFIRKCDAVRELSPVAAVLDVLFERSRQIDVEGWTATHDDNNNDHGALAAAACAYAMYACDELHPQSKESGSFNRPPAMWPFDPSWWKPQDPRRALVKAGALILAEIERLDRAQRLKRFAE